MEWTPEKACCFTGHRKIPVEDRLRLCCLLDDAITSLMVHPLVNSYSLAETLVDEYLKSNRDYIEEWS